jgi:NADH-quinone oxidoreductase subunit K
MPFILFAVTAAGMYALGLVSMLLRRNALYVIVGVLLQSAGTGLLFAAFGNFLARPQGAAMTIVLLALGSLHAAVGFAAFTGLHKQHSAPNLDDSRLLRG